MLTSTARGKIESALSSGQRYFPSDLDALTGASLEHAKTIECGLAYLQILERRPTLLQDLPAGIKNILADLELLAQGVNVLGFDQAMEFGKKWHRVSNPQCLLVDKMRPYFGLPKEPPGG